MTDLALRFGYESPDAFAKAFKREHGVPPRQARKGGVRLRVWPRLSFSIILKGDAAMEFRIEKRGEVAVAGLRTRVSCEGGANMREIPAFWDDCYKKGHVEALGRAIPKGSRMGIMGICVNDLDERTKTFTYLVGVERPTGDGPRTAAASGLFGPHGPRGDVGCVQLARASAGSDSGRLEAHLLRVVPDLGIRARRQPGPRSLPGG